jgi:hypothetical protein
MEPDETDLVNHPPHYTSHPSGVECIQVTEHMGFNLGNAMKYVWRADLKGDAVEDLRKARWYIDREIARRAVQPVPLSEAQQTLLTKLQPATFTGDAHAPFCDGTCRTSPRGSGYVCPSPTAGATS